MSIERTALHKPLAKLTDFATSNGMNIGTSRRDKEIPLVPNALVHAPKVDRIDEW
jgi:hypothetical protein